MNNYIPQKTTDVIIIHALISVSNTCLNTKSVAE